MRTQFVHACYKANKTVISVANQKKKTDCKNTEINRKQIKYA